MDQTKYEADRQVNCLLESPICDHLKTEPCWLGIDEAGRGPVLGPMVYGICFSPVSDKEKFESMGFADSKTLTEEQRDNIFDSINSSLDLLGWMVEILSPAFISSSMLRRDKYNLNALSHDCAIRLVKTALDRGVNVTEIYVDTVGDPNKYQAKLKEIFPTIDVTVAKKADSLYAVVSAASICAKVARDKAVKNWSFSENITLDEPNYGSGYPGDPKTKQFLEASFDKVFGFPSFVRFSWSTASLIIEKDGVLVEWEDDEEDDGAPEDTPTLSHFFKKKNELPEQKPHRFFSQRHLSAVVSL